MKKIFLVSSVIVIILIMGGVVYTLQAPDGSNETEPQEHQINYSQIKVFDPVYVALEKGFFDDEGVTVNLKGETFGGPQALNAAGSGHVDAGIAASTAIINANSSGIEVKGILDVQTAFESSSLMKWLVRKESGIKNAEDLHGKKIGVNSLGASFHYTTLEYLQQHNISPSEVNFVVVPHGNMEQALRSEQIDVAGMIDPYNEIALDKSGLRTLFDAHDVLGVNQFSLIFMREGKMESDPTAVRKFTRAYKKAVDYIENNPTEAANIMADVFGVDQKYISKHKFLPEARVNKDHLKFWLDFMREQGVEELDNLGPDDLGTNQFNETEES